MRKLLSKAKLPPELDKLVKTESDPQVLYDSLDKHLDELIADLQRKFPAVGTEM